MFNRKNKEINKLDELLDKDYEIPEHIKELADSLSGGWWNYRLFENETKWKDISSKEHTEYYYDIHEVYYNAKGEIWAWSENPMSLSFEEYNDLKEVSKQIKRACKHSILKIVPASDTENEEIIDTGKYLKDIKIKF